MLGRELLDPMGVESSTPSMEGLGLLESTTTFEPDKTTKQVRALSLDHEEEIVGYEIHMGQTECARPRRSLGSESSVKAGRPRTALRGRCRPTVPCGERTYMECLTPPPFVVASSMICAHDEAGRRFHRAAIHKPSRGSILWPR